MAVGFDSPQVWEDMRQRLMKLTIKQLKQIAREEHICIGYAASRKDSLVGEIVGTRRHRCLESQENPELHPWRKWHSATWSIESEMS